MEMTRRTFLKLGLATTAISIIPDAAKAILISENKAIPNGYTDTGYIREIRGYDLRRDQYVYRFDISDGKKQFGIDIIQTANKDADAKARENAINLLLKDAEKELDMNNLIKLPDVPECERLN